MLTEPVATGSARRSSSLGDHLAALLDAVADGITVQDASGALVHANAAAAALAGFASARELVEADAATLAAKLAMFDEHGAPVALADLPGRFVLAGEDPPE